MDEVENPEISPAGQEIAATIETSTPLDSGLAVPDNANAPGADTAHQLGLRNAPVVPPASELEGGVKSDALPQNDGSHASRTALEPLTESKPTPTPSAQPAAPPAKPKRPGLGKRESSTIAPRVPPPAVPEKQQQQQQQQQQPEPPMPTDFSQEHPDSLTLAQLRSLRSGFPDPHISNKQELLLLEKVYDFDYRDTQPFPVELEEWFSYSEPERARLRQIHTTFKHAWTRQATPPEGEAAYDFTESPDLGMNFVTQQIDQLRFGSPEQQNESIQVICYLSLGNWEETAGKLSLVDPFASLLGGRKSTATENLDDYQAATFQIQWIVNTLCLLARQGAVQAVYDRLKATCDRDLDESVENGDSNPNSGTKFTEDVVSIDLWCSLTLMYLFVEVGRLAGDTPDAQLLQHELSSTQSKLLLTCINIITQMRWDEKAPVPSTKVFLLTWKTILLCFGGMKDVEKVKASFREQQDEKDQRGQPLITASPLDYHLFRQEICSKYPAYQPPPPLFPFEPENNTILPPLRHRQSKLDSIDSTASMGMGIHGASVMHQPVHIATPAPSPPPSPAMGGKGGKKQNYQTNQMFPFLYPPLDASSNNLGGKGSTELQDTLAGRKWRGSDIPASILEAADLFSKRMRATRAMKQLWETRVDFMKFERGWKEGQENLDIDDFDLDFEEALDLDGPKPKPKPKQPVSSPPPQTDAERRLSAVADFYRDTLPNLQSVIGVLLKKLSENYADSTIFPPDPSFENGNGHVVDNAEHVNNTRTQEIMGKAVSGMLLILLKWFRVSHVLRYEYLTQLLLDTNYVPLFIKIWSVTDMGRACHFKLEKEELNFFNLCRANSRNPKPVVASQAQGEESEDEAMPPPIKLHRDDPAATNSPSPGMSPQGFTHPPEVDELGYPQTALPLMPITNFSSRNTFTFINYLRILQKITRRKAHRSLLLVSYKSSNLLRKSLRVPVDMMRYYTLKLFKSQVPYCGRKWRQTNMKIITAVWLSVPAELRDDWLSGGGGGMGGAGPGDIDGTVEEALPLEQSLRALTHWWNVKSYPEVMGVDQTMVAEEQDFFAKELEKIDINRAEEELLEDSLLEEPWAPLEAY